jgi:hypothetical protein
VTDILDPAEGVRTPPAIPPVTLEDGTIFTIARIDKKVARDLIVANHYSGTWNAAFGTYSFGLFCGGVLRGALAYGNLMNTGSVDSLADLPPDSVIELNRMWAHDSLGPNTETAAIARTMRWLKNNAGIQLVQTFADGRLGCGTVYKAANFGYYGHSETLFFRDLATLEPEHGGWFTITGDSRNMGTFPRPMVSRNLRLVAGDLEAFTVKTYRYLYPLTRYAGRRVLLKQQPYPAYDKGETTLPNYTPPASQIARCFVACTIAGYADQAAKFAAYMSANYPAPDVAESVRQAERNEWLVALADATQPDLFGGVA